MGSTPAIGQWIVVPNWREFQHYRDRHPPWIKLHLSLLTDDAFNRLSHRRQILLVRLWLAYSQNDGRVAVGRAADDRSPTGGHPALSRLLAQRVTNDDLVALSDAGFIELVASAPPRHALAPNEEVEEEKEKGGSASRTRTKENGRWEGAADMHRPAFTFPNGPVTAPGTCDECGVGGGRHAADCLRAVLG